MMKRPSNATCWAIGTQTRNGFKVRRVVWGLVLAQYEQRKGEQVRACLLSVEQKYKRRQDVTKQDVTQPVG